MYKTEEKALAWLKQTRSQTEIHYQRARSPDFITADGHWYEAKRIANKTIYFGNKQYTQLKQNEEKTTILAFSDTSEVPIVIPMVKIESNAILNGLRIIVSKRDVPEGKITVTLLEDESIIDKVDQLAKDRGTDRSAIIREAVRQLLEKHGREVK